MAEEQAAHDPVIKKMLDRFELASNAESRNRKIGLEALKFRVGGDYQWDSEILNLRAGDNRPSESYNQIPQFVHQVTNDMRMNMPQLRFIPGNDGSKDVAEIYEDLARNIQSSSEAEIALDTAADSQVTIGWGYFRILTDYENDKSFDQIIKFGWVQNPFTIYDDPTATMQDRSDRKFLIQIADIPVDDFNATREKKDQYDSLQLSSIGDSQPGWANEDIIRIAEYWTVEETKSKLYRSKITGQVFNKLPSGAESSDYESREVIIPKVKWRKCTAIEVLETIEWAGKYIPYVFVSGEELNVDGQKELSGIVRYMMAPQRQYNYWTNAATEMVALAPKSPFMVAVGQIEGLQKYWDKANVKNYPYLPYRPITVDGALVGAPQRQQAEAPIQAMMAMVQQAQQNMYTTSGIYPASLGKQGNEVSGKAILARQREGDVSTFHFSDNMARAIRFTGRILADLIPKIYDAPRALRLLKEDKSDREVRVNEQYIDDDGQLRNYDLTVGTYDVAVTTGPSYTTRRQEAAETMTQIIQAAPDLMAVAGDLVVGSMDFPGADKLSERLKKTLPPGLADQPKQGNIPPEVQAQLQQAQQVIEQLGQKVQELSQDLQSKQADIQNKEMDTAVKNKELDIKEKELILKQNQIDADVIKSRMNAKVQISSASPEMAMADPELHEGPPPMLSIVSMLGEALNQGLSQVAQITAQSSQAIVESNLLMAKTNEEVAQAIRAPKIINVNRDELGRISTAENVTLQ